MSSEEAEREFLEYNWSESTSWHQYYSNLYPTPSASQLVNFKRKWFQKNVNSALELDFINQNYKRNQESQNQNTQNFDSNFNKRNVILNYSRHKQWMILSLSTSILLTFILLISNFLSLVINIKFTQRITQLCTLSYIIGFVIYLYEISNKPIKFFTMEFWQRVLVEDSFHSLISLFAYYGLLSSFPMIYFIPGVTAIFIVSNYQPILQSKQVLFILNLANQNKNTIYQKRAFFEVIVLGSYLIVGLVTRRISIIYISLYWSLIKAKYSFDLYIQYAFRVTDLQINHFFKRYSNHIPEFIPKCYKWVSLRF